MKIILLLLITSAAAKDNQESINNLLHHVVSINQQLNKRIESLEDRIFTLEFSSIQYRDELADNDTLMLKTLNTLDYLKSVVYSRETPDNVSIPALKVSGGE